MSDEIKEILELIGNSYYYGNIAEEQKEKYCNYITNLQTIEREYSSLLSENAELQQENENLKDFNNKLQATKDRLDKYDRENQLEIDRLNNIVIEVRRYIEEDIKGNYFKRYDDEVYKLCDELLNILDKENNNAKD